MKVEIKICGLQRIEDIEIINKLDVHYAGFIFAPSKRKINIEQAKSLRKLLNPNIKAVGVFVNENIHTINSIANTCNLDIVQFHGEETPLFCSQAIVPVWKALSISSISDINKYQEYPDVHGILLDTFVKGQKGGTGKSFDWSLAREVSEEKFTILAGGLTPDNVHMAIKELRPHIVDVSSGVEVEGYKNRKKIQQFIRRVKEYE